MSRIASELVFQKLKDLACDRNTASSHFIEVLNQYKTLIPIDFQDPTTGNTLLHFALLSGNNTGAKALIALGASQKIKNNQALTAEMICFTMDLSRIEDTPCIVFKFDSPKISKTKSLSEISKTMQERSPTPRQQVLRRISSSNRFSPIPLLQPTTHQTNNDNKAEHQFQTLEALVSIEKNADKKTRLEKFLENSKPLLAKDRLSWTPLMLAAELNSIEIIQWLADYGFDDYYPGPAKQTALKIALLLNHLEVAKYLLFQNLSNPNQTILLPPDNIPVPILYFAFTDSSGFNLKMVEGLLEAGLDFSLIQEKFFNDIESLHQRAEKSKKPSISLEFASNPKETTPQKSEELTQDAIAQFYKQSLKRIHAEIRSQIVILMSEQVLMEKAKEKSLKEFREVPDSFYKKEFCEKREKLLEDKVDHLRTLYERFPQRKRYRTLQGNKSPETLWSNDDFWGVAHQQFKEAYKTLKVLKQYISAVGCIGIIASYCDDAEHRPFTYYYQAKFMKSSEDNKTTLIKPTPRRLNASHATPSLTTQSGPLKDKKEMKNN